MFGAKYATIFAPGATAPATSISSITSASGPFALPVGAFFAELTETLLTVGVVIFNFLKYFFKSDST